jgi:hypothetical protein
MTEDYDALFRQNDDREFWEAPRGFVYLGAGALRFSSFGEMIAFTPDHEAPPDVVDAVAALARTHGYVLIPTEALERDYPGYRDEGPRIHTWWIRFFDWL